MLKSMNITWWVDFSRTALSKVRKSALKQDYLEKKQD